MKKTYITIDGVISRDDKKEITTEQYENIVTDILDVIVKHGCSFGGGLGHHTEKECEEYLNNK